MAALSRRVDCTHGGDALIALPSRRKALRWASCQLAAACLAPTLAMAQERYPSRPVRILVGASAGGGTDILARMLADHWTQSTKQPFVVENRPGAANTLAASLVAKSQPDGHALLLATNTGQAIAPLLLNLPFDPIRDLEAIGLVMVVPHLLLVGPGQPARDAAQLIAAIKARPTGYNYASSGIGSTQHLAGEVLGLAMGAAMSHVPYKGSSAAYPDLISGQVQLMIDTTSSAIAHVQSGRLRALATTAAQRLPQLPDVPTMAEIGYPSVDITTWYGLYAPAATPAAVLDFLHEELHRALADPVILQRLQAMGGAVSGMPRQAFADMNRSEAERYRRLVQATGIKAQ